MRRLVELALLIGLLGYVAGSTSVEDASARTEYKSAFTEKYVDGNQNATFVNAATKAKCLVCHDDNPRNGSGEIDLDNGKKSKKNHNAYGQAVAELITKEVYDAYKEAKKDADASQRDALKAELIERAKQALEKVGKMQSPEGMTYDELFKQGKIPSQPTE